MKSAYQHEQTRKSLVRCAQALAMRREGLTYQAIGEKFGVTRTRAQQMVARGYKVEIFPVRKTRAEVWADLRGGA